MPVPTLNVLCAHRLWLELIYWLSLGSGQASICFLFRITKYHLFKYDLVVKKVLYVLG